MRHKMQRDPAELLTSVVNPGGKRKLILGLDPATSCGACFQFWRPGDPVTVSPQNMGQWDLSAGAYESGAIRFVRLKRFLEAAKPDLIGYEEPRFTPSEKPNKFNVGGILARAATSCEFMGALKGVICSFAEENGIPCVAWPIGTIKKRATGKGNASKTDMIAAANEQFGSALDPEGYESTGVDNVADAAWVTMLTLEDYAPGLVYEKAG